MAEKIEKPAKQPDAGEKKKTGPENEAAILLPDVDVEIAGRKVSVREFSFSESARLAPRIRPLLKDLEAATEADEAPGLEALDDLLAAHFDLMSELAARAADQPPAWVRSLSATDGETLMLTFWRVNGPFFLRRLMIRKVAAEAQAQASAQSSQPSSATATNGPQ